MDEGKLNKDLVKLLDLKYGVFKQIFEEEIEDDSMLYEYKNLKAEILLELNKSNRIPQITDPALRSELRDFLKDSDQIMDKLREIGVNKKIREDFNKAFEPEFSNKRLEEVADEEFLSWYNQYEYVDRLIKTGNIIIKNIDLPDELHALTSELRQCIIFQNYLAAGILLRTIAEIAVHDIIKRNFEDVQFSNFQEELNFLESKSRFCQPASSLNIYRKDLNKFVHGKRIMNKDKIYGYVDVIMDQVQKLYDNSN